MSKPTYTLEEAAAILGRRKCEERRFHDFRIDYRDVPDYWDAPDVVRCADCSARWEIASSPT